MNYGRAARIANSAGPYITPDKEKPPRDSAVDGQVISLDLLKEQQQKNAPGADGASGS